MQISEKSLVCQRYYLCYCGHVAVLYVSWPPKSFGPQLKCVRMT